MEIPPTDDSGILPIQDTSVHDKKSTMDAFSALFISVLLAIPNCVVLTALKDFRREDKHRSGFFHVMEGFCLSDHILSTHYSESSLICGFLCLRNKRCVSFNFGRRSTSDGKFLCELSNSKAIQFPMDLKRQGAFDYFTFLNICQDGSVCHLHSSSVSRSARCPLEIAILPYIDDHCNVNTSLILLSKGERSITNITHVSFDPRYSFNFSEAVRVCEILNGTLATFEQIQAAWNNGLQRCSYGWLDDGITVVPMQEHRSMCLSIGLNPSSKNIDKGRKFDAYCFGVKA